MLNKEQRYLFQSKKFVACREKKPWQLAVFLNCILVYILPRPSHMCILIGPKLWSGRRSKRKQLSLGRRLNGKDFGYWNENSHQNLLKQLQLAALTNQIFRQVFWGEFPRSFGPFPEPLGKYVTFGFRFGLGS